jgi:hypothetical protein
MRQGQSIEDWYGYKSRGGDYVLVVTVEADKAQGEPSTYREGQYYLVNKRQVVDFETYQKRIGAQRAKFEAEQAEQRAATQRRRALDAAYLLHVIREANVSDEAAGAIQQLVNAGKLSLSRPFNWKPEDESNDSGVESTEGGRLSS